MTFTRRRFLKTGVAAALTLAASGPAPADPAAAPEAYPISLPDKGGPEMAWWRQSMLTHDQRMAWWRKARLGMFLHWGVYSQLGGEWDGKQYRGYAEHIQRMAKIPIPVYRQRVAGAFNPTQFNADEWVRLAKQAGMGYIVITAKHHDGFAMYDSKVSDYNVVQATPWHHDPMRDLKTACDKYGLRLGFYYSHAFDWGDAEAPGNDWDYANPGGDRLLHGGEKWWASSPQYLPQVDHYLNRKAIPQIQELIKNYHPAILWFDTPHKNPPGENLRVLKATREAGPDVIIDGRLLTGYGDYASTADRPAEFKPQAGDWEGVPTTNESYGYNKGDHSQKPPPFFIRLIAKAAARGGNLLMNIGPMGDGRFDPADVSILEGIGKWMAVNGDSIHGTERTPLPVQAWGESTRQGNLLYLHVFDWPRDGQLVLGGLRADVKGAHLLSDPKRAPLSVERLNPLDVRITVPAAAPDAVDSVVAIETAGLSSPDSVDATRLLSPMQINTLRVFDGNLTGSTITFGDGKKENAYVLNWSKPTEFISWPARLTEPTTFDVSVSYDAEAGSAGGAYAVAIGTQTLTGTVQASNGRMLPLGRVPLAPGFFEVRVTPTQIQGRELMRLRSLTLTPVPAGAKL